MLKCLNPQQDLKKIRTLQTHLIGKDLKSRKKDTAFKGD